MSKAQVIYIVDDESTLREVVRRYLELDGFQVVEAETGPEALERLREKPADLILLDIMLPGLDGFTVTRSLRNVPEYQVALGSVPIIMLTSRGDEIDRITGFELGVDDYVVKPFSPRELVARVKAVLRRSAVGGEPAQQPLTFTGLHIDPLRRVVTLRGEAVVLTAKEFDLLWFFARHPRQVLTREQLLNQVWGYEFYGDESTVTVHIRRLREKIEPDPSDPTYIHTVRGAGYKFDPD
ncbi:MAG: response regulator transcription factor [Chloroflexi bacterium]|nr:response regulator transcription factor [Chloroflexota bacterium]